MSYELKLALTRSAKPGALWKEQGTGRVYTFLNHVDKNRVKIVCNETVKARRLWRRTLARDFDPVIEEPAKPTKLERSYTVNFRWWRDDNQPIRDLHVEALEEKAWERIGQQIPEGYTCGELIDHVHCDDQDPEDGQTYHGWWELKVQQ